MCIFMYVCVEYVRVSTSCVRQNTPPIRCLSSYNVRSPIPSSQDTFYLRPTNLTHKFPETQPLASPLPLSLYPRFRTAKRYHTQCDGGKGWLVCDVVCCVKDGEGSPVWSLEIERRRGMCEIVVLYMVFVWRYMRRDHGEQIGGG